MAASVKEVYCPITDGPCQAVNKTPCAENPSSPQCEQKAQDIGAKLLAMTIHALTNGGLERLRKGDQVALIDEATKNNPLTDHIAQSVVSASVDLGLSPAQTRELYLRSVEKARKMFWGLFGGNESLSNEISSNRDFETLVPPVE